MRFDLLDEYSTLVPFRLGVSKRNSVVQYPGSPRQVVKPGVIANCVCRLKILLRFRKAATSSDKDGDCSHPEVKKCLPGVRSRLLTMD